MKTMLAAAFTLAIIVAARAELYFYEGFDYAAGTVLKTTDGWLHSGSSPNQVIANASLSVSGFPESTGNHVEADPSGDGTYVDTYDYDYPTNATVSGDAYMSIVVQVNDVSALTTNVTIFRFRNIGYNAVRIRKNANVPANFDIGMGGYGWTPDGADSVWGTNGGNGYVVGTPMLMVCAFDSDWGSTTDGRLWVNPNRSTFGAAAAPGGYLEHDWRDTCKPYLDGYNGAAVSLDEIRVGSTWADVTPSGTVKGSTFIGF